MELERARFLVSDAGKQALAILGPALASLAPHQLVANLRRDHPPAEASALAEQIALRARAAERFGGLLDFLYTSEGLEMMTHPAVARRRAARLATFGLEVLDLTCGLGGDLRAIAETGMRVAGLERDRATALLAAANVPGAAIVQGDAARPPFVLSGRAIFLDPSRRGAEGRRFGPGAFLPPWEVSLDLLREARLGVLKAPPGIDHQLVPAAAEVELVQLGRSLREATVWLGLGSEPGVRRAVLLPEGFSISSTEPQASAAPMRPGAFIFDPESCVTRAGLVRHLAHRLGASLLDPRVAYLTADRAAFDPLAATFEVLDSVPFSIARLKQRLRTAGWRPDEIRRRAFPLEPDEIRRLLGRIEGTPVALLCTTIAAQRTVFVGRRLKPIEETAHGCRQ